MNLFTITVNARECALRYRHGTLEQVLPAGRPVGSVGRATSGSTCATHCSPCRRRRSSPPMRSR